MSGTFSKRFFKRIIFFSFVFASLLGWMPLANAATATFNTTYQAPYCSGSNASCDSGASLVNCRYGAETNQPNTVNDSCPDGVYAGACGLYESNNSLSIATNDGSPLAFGKAVTVSATVYCRNTSNRVSLYYTDSVIGSPTWTQIGSTLTCGTGIQTKTVGYTIPSVGTTHAIRAQITYGLPSSACDLYQTHDRDDLVFDVQPPDSNAPAAVSNLAASSPTPTSISLSWTAPGDDGSSGTATSYDVRYSTALITDANWASATQASGEPAPAVAGTNQSMTVSSLNAGTTYYFAMKTSDEIPNISPLSNVPSMATLPPPPPTVTTNAASAITTTSATLNGSANPNGFATTGWFRYSATNPGSCTDSFGTRLPASGGTALGSGSSAVAYSNSAGGLTSGTTYYYCAIASNGGGTAFGSVLFFDVPLPAAPTFPTPLAANPTSVVSGGPSTLTWASSGATSCSASAVPANGQWDDVPSPPALSGSQLITNITVTTAFTITCTNAGGSTPSSATVTVTPPPNVSGYAWADNIIGWLKMSGTAGDGSPYGVLVSSANPGVLSGYAWANPNDGAQNNIGWIDFGPAGAYPASSFVPAQSARMNRTTGLVSGWARACSVFISGCSGALKADSERGGWDGWIGFGTGGNYTQPVTVSGCNWSGYAWGGGTTIGWIHFGGALYPMTGSGDGCTSSADLTPGTVSPPSALTGTATTFSSTISNIGIGATGAGFTNLFQFDSNADHTAITDTRTDTSPALATGGTDVSQVSYTFPTAGTWYVRACADNNASFIGTITESNESNNCGAWTPVAVALPILTGTFSASPDTIDPGNPSTLTWTSNATSCVGAGFSTGAGSPANGSAVVAPTTTGPNSYQITCSRSGYEDLTLATTVTVISVTVSINAKPSCISGGGSSKVSWSASPESQIASCTISSSPASPGFPITRSAPPFTGEQTATVSNTKYTFTIACTTDGGGTVAKSAVVDVTSCWTEF